MSIKIGNYFSIPNPQFNINIINILKLKHKIRNICSMEFAMYEPSFFERMSEYYASQGKILPDYYKEEIPPPIIRKKKPTRFRFFGLKKRRKQVIIKSTSISSISSNDELLGRDSI